MNTNIKIMKYLKKFDNHTLYEAAKQDLILPNVSLCVQENEVHYNPIETRVVVKFNVASANSTTQIMGSSAASLFSKIWIDDVEQQNVITSYTFSTAGEHTVKYELVNSATIGQSAFDSCIKLTSAIIPEGVTTIGKWAFYGCVSLSNISIPDSLTTIGYSPFYNCRDLTSITIPSGVTSIDSYAFQSCRGLETITSLATTAPTIQSNSFKDVKTNGTLYVPTGSDYSVWMDSGNYYLGSYSWTKVEQ